MKRRAFMQFAAGAAVTWSRPASAQQNQGLPLVAVISPATEESATRRIAGLRAGLSQAGLVEGQNYALAVRFADGDMSRLPTLVAELRALKPRVFVAAANAALVVRLQAPETPMVFTGVAADVIALGWAESYARPNGMVTGNIQNAIGGEEAVTTKRIGLFKELMPNLGRLGMIGFATNISNLEYAGLRKASSQLGFEVMRYDLPKPGLGGLDEAVAAGLRDDVDAFYLSGYFVIFGHTTEVVSSVAGTGKPICGVYAEFARAGCLMSYSVDLEHGYRLCGVQVAKVLRGTKPGDLPIEQADKFSLTINVAAARRLGVPVPDRILTIADELVE